MNMELINLRQQLSQFGLNPQDWILENKGSGQYLVRHSQDFQTYFLGLAEQNLNSLKWQKLEIAI